MLEATPEDVVLEKGRELAAHCLIFIPSHFHCKQLWDIKFQQVHDKVSSPAILMVMLCHRLEKVQEVVVVVCTTEPGGGVIGGR